MRSVGVVNMTWNLRSKIKVLNISAIDENLLKLHKCTIKGETKRKRGHLEETKKTGWKGWPNLRTRGGATQKRDKSGAE